MEMNIRMGINRKPWLLPTIYNNLQSFTEFEEDFHHVYIRVWNDPTKTWRELPYFAINDVIFIVLESWPPEWCTPVGSVVEAKKSTMQ